MKTRRATGQILYSVETNGSHVPDGCVLVNVVQFQTFEIPRAEFEAMTFQVLDVNSPEVRAIASLAKKTS